MALTAETTQAAAGLLKQAYADEAITKFHQQERKQTQSEKENQDGNASKSAA